MTGATLGTGTNANKVTLTLGTAIEAGNTASIAYTAAAGTGNSIKDAAATPNNAADQTLASGSVTNSSTADITAPTAAAAAASLAFSADTGSSSTDFKTKTAAQNLSGTYTGTLGTGEFVEISLDNGSTWTTATTASGGNWTLTGRTLTGSNTLQVRVTDAAGNSSAAITQAYVYDIAAPTATATTATIKNSTNATVQSSEIGTAYLVKSTVSVSSETDITGAADNNFNSVTISSANSDTSLAATGLVDGSYKVYTVDAAGNFSAVSTNTVTVDTTAPSITSSATASAINENSGAGQTIYTATATDAATLTYSLKAATGDVASFSINGSSGAVALTGNPDYETKASYAFTVVATDTAGNASEQAVTLAINDIADEVAPVVSGVAISGATGAQNNYLNAGDVISVTVTLGEATVVNTSGGTPYVNLNIGGTTVQAGYTSGSGTTSLVFQYTILTAQTDSDGISIAADSINLNNGTLKDAAGNNATITHNLVAANASYKVDTTAPTLSSSTPADNATGVTVSSNIVLNFNESVQAGSGNIVITDGASDTRTIAVGDGQVTGGGTTAITVNPTSNLSYSTGYDVTMASGVLTDLAGNAFAGIATNALDFTTGAALDPNVVVFDLVEGVSSSHSGRTFSAGVAYTIYIKVDSTSNTLSWDGTSTLNGTATWGAWSSANNLGADDKIVLVGTDVAVKGKRILDAAGVVTQTTGNRIVWYDNGTSAANQGKVAVLYKNGRIQRMYNGVSQSLAANALWTGNWAANPDQGSAFGNVYLVGMPAGVLASQGLA